MRVSKFDRRICRFLLDGTHGMQRSRRLEGRLQRGRGAQMALPLLRQEVQVPHRHRPRALPQAASLLGLLHQANEPQRPRRVRGRAVRRHLQDRLRVAAPRARHGIRLPGLDRAARRLWVDETYLNDTYLSKGYGQAPSAACPVLPEALHLRAIDVHKNPVAGV